MKLSDFKAESIPAIQVRNGLETKEVKPEALVNSGAGLVRYTLNVGETIEFPDNEDEARIIQRQVRAGADSYETLILVKKGKVPAWFSIANLRRQDVNRKPVHPVAEALDKCANDYERLNECYGKKITATEEVTYQAQKFSDDGQRIEGETVERTVAKLVFA